MIGELRNWKSFHIAGGQNASGCKKPLLRGNRIFAASERTSMVANIKIKPDELTLAQRRCEMIRILSGGVSRMNPPVNLLSKTLQNHQKTPCSVARNEAQCVCCKPRIPTEKGGEA